MFALHSCCCRDCPADLAASRAYLLCHSTTWLQQYGAASVLDISPITCMNGIVSEALYPRLSRDYGTIPIHSLYFDGTCAATDQQLELFMELIRSRQK